MMYKLIKRIHIYLFSIAVASLFCSCGQMGGGQGDATDTIVQDTVIVAEQLEPEPEPESQAEFTSTDLKFYRLQGHVKSVSETSIYYNSIENQKFTDHNNFRFTENGKLKPSKGCHVRRNKKGQIVEMTVEIDYAGDPEELYYAYKYNTDGYVIKELSSDSEMDYEERYQLNEKGWVISSKQFSYYAGESICETSSYSYSQIDVHGNWHKAVIKFKGRDWEGKNYSGTKTITRKITYWE